MKKYLLIALCAAAVGLSAQDQLPKWATDLETLNPGLIDSILYYNTDPDAPDTRTYVVYYNQPLKHAQAGSAKFPLRALITVFKDSDPTTAVNHIYASGYSIMKESLDNPDASFATSKDDSDAEIAHRYHANHIQIEHRYFQQSAPAECWTMLDDLRAEEAAADFHNLFEALKKVLKGKYVMSGVSKGGITTLLQHRFYPNDMDIFVPYAAPFFNTDRDTEMQQYMLTNGWSKEYRDLFLAVQKNGTYRRDAIFPIYLKMQGGADTQAKQDTIYMYYLCAVGEFGYEEHCYSDTASIRRQMYRNDSIMRAKHVEAYGDTVYAYMFEKVSFSLDSFPKWIDTLRKYPEPKQAPSVKKQKQFIRPFGITYDQWWSDTINAAAYEYQAKTELGYFDLRFDLLVDDAADAAGFNELWKEKAGCKMDLEKPFYRSLTFNPALYNETMTATRNATTPIVLIYGQDDAWTGAAVKDEFINGVNVHKFILPAQNHSVHFTSNTDRAMCEQLRTILDGVLGAPHGIEPVTEPSLPVTRKVMRDGKIVILRNDETYDLTGRKLTSE